MQGLIIASLLSLCVAAPLDDGASDRESRTVQTDLEQIAARSHGIVEGNGGKSFIFVLTKRKEDSEGETGTLNSAGENSYTVKKGGSIRDLLEVEGGAEGLSGTKKEVFELLGGEEGISKLLGEQQDVAEVRNPAGGVVRFPEPERTIGNVRGDGGGFADYVPAYEGGFNGAKGGIDQLRKSVLSVGDFLRGDGGFGGLQGAERGIPETLGDENGFFRFRGIEEGIAESPNRRVNIGKFQRGKDGIRMLKGPNEGKSGMEVYELIGTDDSLDKLGGIGKNIYEILGVQKEMEEEPVEYDLVVSEDGFRRLSESGIDINALIKKNQKDIRILRQTSPTEGYGRGTVQVNGAQNGNGRLIKSEDDTGKLIGGGRYFERKMNTGRLDPLSCGHGQTMNAVGNCEQPEIYKNIIFFESPVPEVLNSPPPVVPKPRVDYNIVFVHTPKQQVSPEPIVIAPPEKRTIVYVLTKNGQSQQQVIEVPAGPGQAPEVFYVNYNEGDDHVLHGGMSLQDILAKGTDLGQLVAIDSGESEDDVEAPVEEYL